MLRDASHFLPTGKLSLLVDT